MDPSWRVSGAAPTGLGKAEVSSDSQVSPFILWNADEGRVAIEFHRLLLEQIRQACFEVPRGAQHRGAGVAGLLFGTRLGDFWRVLGWQQFECGSSRENPFQLDGIAEQARLRQQIRELSAGGPQLIGWFANHARGGLAVSQAERSVHEEFFSDAERLMLTVRTSRHGDMMMQIHLPAASLDDRLLARTPEIRVVPISGALYKPAYPEQVESPQTPSPQASPAPHSRVQSTYLGFGFAVALVIAAALGVLFWQLTQSAPSRNPSEAAAASAAVKPARLLSLHAEYRSSRLSVRWDPRAYEDAEITSATVTYAGDSFSRRVRLGGGAIRNGRASISIRRPPGLVTLTLQTRDGREINESVSFTNLSRKK